MRKKLKWSGSFSFLVILMVLAGCSQDASVETEPAQQEVPVQVAPVEYGSLSGSNQLTGTVEPEDNVEVTAPTSAEITEIYVEQGDTVQQGETIAQLDDSQEQNTVQQQQASVDQAQAGLASAETGVTTARQNRDQAVAALEQAQASLEEARQNQGNSQDNAQYQVENAELALEQTQQSFNRVSELYEAGLTSQQNYEDAQNAVENARLSLEQARLGQTQAESEVGLASLEASVDQAETGVEIAETSIDNAQASVSQAQATVDQAVASLESSQDNAADKVITAPVSGEVTDVALEVGQMASPQSPFATIVSTNNLNATVNVLPDQLNNLNVGDEVEIEVDGSEETYTGTISYISPVGNDSGLFTVEAEIPNPGENVLPGMVATIIVDEVMASNSYIVPTESIVTQGETDSVYVIRDGAAHQVEVQVNHTESTQTAVSGEFQENEQVVISGQNLLEDGNPVQIMEEE